MREAAGMFDKNVLCQLKKECGGLQTLLRNWHQVFEGVCCHSSNVCIVIAFARSGFFL